MGREYHGMVLGDFGLMVEEAFDNQPGFTSNL